MKMTLDELRAWQKQHIAKETGPLFMGLPDRWYDDPHYRCPNGHISTTILKSEAKGCSCCLSCWEPVILTFSEDKE